MNHIRIAVCSIVLLILAGCKGGKELISERPVSQEVRNNFESLMASYPDWNTFSAKGSADLSFGASGSLSASTQLRMVRGEVLQISVRIILGIEVARLYMTPDSLFLVNKMQKQYVAASLQEIGERLSSPVSLLHPPSQPNDFHTVGKYVRLAYADSLPHYQQIWNIP